MQAWCWVLQFCGKAESRSLRSSKKFLPQGLYNSVSTEAQSLRLRVHL